MERREMIVMGCCCPDAVSTLASNEICGNFAVPCQTDTPTPVVLYDTDGTVTPSGTVSIYYDKGCGETLTVTVTDSTGTTDTFDVPPKNTRSRTYDDIVSLAITCTSTATPPETGQCVGKYCVDLNYMVNAGQETVI